MLLLVTTVWFGFGWFFNSGRLAVMERQLAKVQAMADTGPCGDMQEVVLNEGREVAIGGIVISTAERNDYTFKDDETSLRVVHRFTGRVIMLRDKKKR